MKKIIYILAFAFIAILATSCNDGFLDKTPLDKLSEEAVFNSDALAQSYVNGLYVCLPDPFQEGNIGCISDEGFFRYGGSSTRFIADGSMTPDNIMYMSEGGSLHNSRQTILNIWNRMYEYIYKMNYFINYVTTKKTGLSETAKNTLLGEVHYLRAWGYANLIERYAGVPIITRPYTLNDNFDTKRNDFDECVDFILADLDTAYNLLPSVDKAVQGRANKDVALALRSRLTLIAASPLFNDPQNPEGGIFRGKYDASKWQRALAASKAIVDRADVDGAYALGPTYDDYWINADSKEIIWGKFFVPTASTENDNSAKKAQLLYSVVYYNGWTSMNPTQAIFMDYEMKNGKKFFEDGSGYDPQHPFANRDPRFYKSLATNFSLYGHTESSGYAETPLDLSLYYSKSTRDDFAAGKTEPNYTEKGKHLWHATNTAGIELNKWYIPTKVITEAETGSVVYPWFRLAEMYLNYAECAYMTGDETTCRTYINKVRHRADVMMPDVTESGTSLFDRLVNERRIELAFETFRYFDLRRWKLAPQYENVPFAGMRTMILNGGKDTVYRVVRLYDESKNNTCYYWANNPSRDAYISGNRGEDIRYIQEYSWLGKTYKIDFGDCMLNISATQKKFPLSNGVYSNYLMPIPRNEITKSNGTIEQNPGY
jgi:hypothetical protein